MTRFFLTLSGCVLLAIPTLAADDKPAEKDSPQVAATKKKLDKKMDADFKDVRLKECLDEIKQEIGASFYYDVGVSLNQAITYKGKDQTAAQVLDGMFKGRGLGYIVHRKKNNADRYEGWIQIVQGDNRGDETPPKKEEPKKDK